MNVQAAEFFAGMGLMRTGLESIGIETVFANDIDETEAAPHHGNWGCDQLVVRDIRTITGRKIPHIDLATAAFPCANPSLAGRRGGLLGDQSNLVPDFLRILDEMGGRTPSTILIESAPGFLTSDNGEDWRIVKSGLRRIGHATDHGFSEKGFLSERTCGLRCNGKTREGRGRAGANATPDEPLPQLPPQRPDPARTAAARMRRINALNADAGRERNKAFCNKPWFRAANGDDGCMDAPRKLAAAHGILAEEYGQSHGHPRAVAYSGGNDSTLLLQLTWEMLAALPKNARRRRVLAVANDTLVEASPMVAHLRASLARVAAGADRGACRLKPTSRSRTSTRPSGST